MAQVTKVKSFTAKDATVAKEKRSLTAKDAQDAKEGEQLYREGNDNKVESKT